MSAQLWPPGLQRLVRLASLESLPCTSQSRLCCSPVWRGSVVSFRSAVTAAHVRQFVLDPADRGVSRGIEFRH